MWATVQDIQDRWLTGELPATDHQIQVLIDDAEDKILTEFPKTPDNMLAGVLREGTVKRVVARMVNRVLRNPEGYRTTQTTTGPFSESNTHGGDNPGEVYLTDDDRRDLSGERTRRRAYTVSTIPQGWR